MIQVETAFEILVDARASLVELYGQYHAKLMYDGVGANDQVASKTTQEVFKYVFAATALVQAYRRFCTFDAPDKDGYDSALNKAFHDVALKNFVHKLRNCYGHDWVIRVSPVGKISFTEDRQVESALTFNKELLLLLKGAWNTEAKSFLEKNDELNVLEIISQYHGMASEMFHSYGSASGAIHSVGYREVIRCKQAFTSAGHVTTLSILLQGAKQRGTDPYIHLPTYFTKEELERIRCFQSHSREQVDFMIAIRDPLGFCDEALRKKLYALFDC
jgi:hypothetical protein